MYFNLIDLLLIVSVLCIGLLVYCAALLPFFLFVFFVILRAVFKGFAGSNPPKRLEMFFILHKNEDIVSEMRVGSITFLVTHSIRQQTNSSVKTMTKRRLKQVEIYY